MATSNSNPGTQDASERKFVCPLCGKSRREVFRLKEHLKDKHAYGCTFCNRCLARFDNPQALVTHQEGDQFCARPEKPPPAGMITAMQVAKLDSIKRFSDEEAIYQEIVNIVKPRVVDSSSGQSSAEDSPIDSQRPGQSSRTTAIDSTIDTSPDAVDENLNIDPINLQSLTMKLSALSNDSGTQTPNYGPPYQEYDAHEVQTAVDAPELQIGNEDDVPDPQFYDAYGTQTTEDTPDPQFYDAYGTQMMDDVPDPQFYDAYGTQTTEDTPDPQFYDAYGTQMMDDVPDPQFYDAYGTQTTEDTPDPQFYDAYGTQMMDDVPDSHFYYHLPVDAFDWSLTPPEL